MRHRALSWLSTLVFKGGRGCTAGEGSGWACQVSQTFQRALGTLPEHWVHLLPAWPGDLTAAKLGMAHHYIPGRAPWGSLFGWWFLHLDLELGYLN